MSSNNDEGTENRSENDPSNNSLNEETAKKVKSEMKAIGNLILTNFLIFLSKTARGSNQSARGESISRIMFLLNILTFKLTE